MEFAPVRAPPRLTEAVGAFVREHIEPVEPEVLRDIRERRSRGQDRGRRSR